MTASLSVLRPFSTCRFLDYCFFNGYSASFVEDASCKFSPKTIKENREGKFDGLVDELRFNEAQK